MKITVKQLRNLINESINENIEASYEELDRRISSMDPDTIADQDYIDEETGEVYLERGEQASSSHLHPDYDSTRKEPVYDDYEDDEGDGTNWIDDELGSLGNESLRAEFDQAVSEFAQGFIEDYDSGMSNDAEYYDAAENFFAMHQDDWPVWSSALGLSRQEIKTYVADMMAG